jgi:hypothetical protein
VVPEPGVEAIDFARGRIVGAEFVQPAVGRNGRGRLGSDIPDARRHGRERPEVFPDHDASPVADPEAAKCLAASGLLVLPADPGRADTADRIIHRSAAKVDATGVPVDGSGVDV